MGVGKKYNIKHIKLRKYGKGGRKEVYRVYHKGRNRKTENFWF